MTRLRVRLRQRSRAAAPEAPSEAVGKGAACDWCGGWRGSRRQAVGRRGAARLDLLLQLRWLMMRQQMPTSVCCRGTHPRRMGPSGAKRPLSSVRPLRSSRCLRCPASQLWMQMG